MKFSIRLYGISPATGKELAGTDYIDHASRIARSMFDLYSFRIDVYDMQDEEPKLIEFWDWMPNKNPVATRVPIDPRTGHAYA